MKKLKTLKKAIFHIQRDSLEYLSNCVAKFPEGQRSLIDGRMVHVFSINYGMVYYTDRDKMGKRYESKSIDMMHPKEMLALISIIPENGK